MDFFNCIKGSQENSLATSKQILKSALSNKKQDQKTSQITKLWENKLINNQNTISYLKENSADDKKDTLAQKFKMVKDKIKNTFSNNVYKPLTFYEFHMVDHLHNNYLSLPNDKIFEFIPYSPNLKQFIDILAFTKDVIKAEQLSQNLKLQVIGEISSLISKIENVAKKNKSSQSYSQLQINILLMICSFKALSQKYDPYRRKVIKRIFNQLCSDSFMNTMETLRYLQNQRKQVQLLPQIQQDDLKRRNKQILEKTSAKLGTKGKYPDIQLVKVSQNKRRKVVNILVSGFLSEDMDKKSQWKALLNCMPDSQVYGLNWQSQKINDLVGFMAKTAGKLIFTSQTLQQSFQNNPFNSAFKVAQQSGVYLAYLASQLFPNQFINIIGYSLGTELIKQFVNTTLLINKGVNLQRIILLGGVSDIPDYDKAISQYTHPLSVTNCYTQNDSVLQQLLKKCRKGIQPVGLKELFKSRKHGISNNDVSENISGHLSYMTNFGLIADHLELNQQ